MNAVVVGASGGIGHAFVDLLAGMPTVATVVALSRRDPGFKNAKIHWSHVDIENETAIANTAAQVSARNAPLHIVIVATGRLHDGPAFQPEKSWRGISADALEAAFRLNTSGPTLVAKHYLPLLARDGKSVFAALSARVGSIEDNHLGGWHAYRASKAALNMIIKTLSIELARRNPSAILAALHPGTVDTPLSQPFQRGVPEGKLFPPERSAALLLNVLNGLTPEDSGGLFAWDGQKLPF